MTDQIDMMEEQRRNEEEAALTGIRRAARAMEKAKAGEREATTQVGSALVRRIVEPMAELLRADLEARKGGRASKGGAALKAIKDLDLHLVCLVATRAALSRMSRPTKLAALARRIGEAVEDEVIWKRWEALDKHQAKAVRQRVNVSKSAHQRRKALRGFSAAWQDDALKVAWSSHQLVSGGLRFIDYLVKLQVFEMTSISTSRPGKKRSSAHAVRLSGAAANWVNDMADFLAVCRPLQWPLVVPPIPWTSTSGGGFHFREQLDHPSIPRQLKPLPLVRSTCREHKEMLATADLSTVYAGLNAAQATAWRVNPKVYAVLARMVEDGRGGPGLSMADPAPLPERLSDEEVKDEERFRAHKNKMRLVHLGNSRLTSKRFAQHRVYVAARKFVTYPSIYFTFNLDFRGRVYTCSDDLSPQGNDLQRGLLEFSEGDELGVEGPHWLAVHLANTYGVDKVSFDERVRWTYAHLAMIQAVADDPIACEAWYKADSPWQFLAACFAWADYMEKGPESVCRVPVMLDGSCSGIQHYAALMRDAEAGTYVNLKPGAKPADLYQRVADKTMEQLKDVSPWHAFGVDRKLVKRSVMVLPYGGTFLSNLDYVREAVRKRLDTEERPAWLTEENEKKRVLELAQTVWKAMPEVVAGPLRGMKWVRSVVRAWSKEQAQTKFHWTAPCGFPVVSDYRVRSSSVQHVKANVGGENLSVGVWDQLDEIDWGSVERAAPPNFVHSLDASHLLISLKRAHAEGIERLAIVHDAFGTTPTKTGHFARVLREEFARMYESNPLEVLTASAQTAGVEPPELPPVGALDTAEIARSDYLFA